TSSIEDHDLPKAILQRIIKSVLPEGAAVQRDAKTALSKACTVFINYLAATAHDVASDEHRKIISANDVLAAMHTIELGDMVPQMEAELEGNCPYKQLKQKRKTGEEASTAVVAHNDGEEEEDEGE
ncbi:histone-fold-containing protein, partial [Syncephalis pseudoplumigaleata]